MFNYGTKFNRDLSFWDVSKVTTMRHMFNSANAFNGNISSWDVSSVTESFIPPPSMEIFHRGMYHP
jgi:surface protein